MIPYTRLALAALLPATALAYDAMEKGGPGTTSDYTIHDANRNRDIPVRIYLPEKDEPAPVILFSHGLGGSREGPAYLGEHWSSRGYAVVYLQHPGSDESVWKDKPVLQRMEALQKAASLTNALLRVQDVKTVLDQLTAWQTSPGHALAGRLDLDHVGMSGHSFGAATTQAVSGQSLPNGEPRFTDPRIKAAIAMSPSSARNANAFAKVSIPWLLMTGTKDGSPIGNQTPEDRLKVFPALPEGHHCQLVLDNAEHSAFGDRSLPNEKEKRNPNHHRVILALSTAFWDAHLKGDETAREWLYGEGPQSVLEPKDRWEVR